jgi:hypothetical protein
LRRLHAIKIVSPLRAHSGGDPDVDTEKLALHDSSGSKECRGIRSLMQAEDKQLQDTAAFPLDGATCIAID